MAEFRRLPTQQELQQILFMQGLRPQSTQDILQQNLQSQTITPLPENVFQKIAGGARRAGQIVNQAGTAADVAKLFPGYTGQSQVNIPTGFNFAPKQDPMGGVIPQGLQTQQMNVGQLLQAIKPADVLGISGAERAYTDIGQGKAPKPLDVLDVAGLGAVGYGAGKTALNLTKNVPVGMSIQEAKGLLQTAPKSDIGFYSAVEQAALASPRKQATGQAFLNDIMKGPDVRADEIKWMGLDDFLKGKQSVTKQEVQDFIANNRVDVQEVRSTIPRIPGEEMPGDKGAFLPRFAQYQLPGGENYRELLLTMPNTKAAKLDARRAEIEAKGFDATEADRNEWASIMNQLRPENRDIEGISRFRGMPDFKSTHFDQPNILAHLRVNDRVDADGKKMLLIEEVQSDWHQTGRDVGYKTKQNLENWYNQNKLESDPPFSDLNSEQISIIERNRNAGMGGDTSVPDAPMKDTWYQLALKRAIQVAAEQGYDRIGLTTGARQAERFDLSKHIDVLSASKNQDGTFNIQGFKDEGHRERGRRAPLVNESNVTAESLSGVVGKDLAKRIIDEGGGDYSGIDLRVGGEGMKKYYDEIYPKFLDKYGKKWGAKVGETKIRTHSDKQIQEDLDLLEQLGEDRSKLNSSGMEPVRYIDITPEMKASVSKGQPLFQAIPAIGTGGLLGAQEEQQ
jgi:hypothetical protein